MQWTAEQEARKQAIITRRQQQHENQQADAAETLKNHVYTNLANQEGVQVWRCQEPGSTCYAFDIVMTRFGIAILGDIPNITFSVGLGYGMKFLAGDDITYYIHSKVDQVCRSREFCQDSFRVAIMQGICRRLLDACDDSTWQLLPDVLKYQDDITFAHWEEVREAVRSHFRESTDDRWRHWDDLLDTADGIAHTEAAYSFMAENFEVLGLGDDFDHTPIQKDSERLINELYLINHAAKAIIAQQAEQGGSNAS